MKSTFHLFFIFFAFQLNAQSTLILKPNGENGKDAAMCSSQTWSTGESYADRNWGDYFALRNVSWTAYIHNSPNHDWWSLLEFEALDTLQQLDVISATLKLFELPDNPWSNGGQFGENQSELFRVTEHWEEIEVTWNTQPDYDQSSSIVIPQNNDFDSIMVDVTDWVKDMIANPADNHGFLVRPSNEVHYRSMTFSSSDHDNPQLWPELVIEYQGTEEPEEPQIECQFEFPNVFTPNGDGINDSFGLTSNCAEQVHCTLQIFNRWGNLVYRTVETQKRWDGRVENAGKMAASDVYIFRATVFYENEEMVFEGDVTLLR